MQQYDDHGRPTAVGAVRRGAETWGFLLREGPWTRAVAGAVAGAAAAVVVAVLARRLGTRDAPGAQDPDQVQAVVDVVPVAVAVPVVDEDEDGEQVGPA